MVREGALSSNLVALNGPCSRLKKKPVLSGDRLVVDALDRRQRRLRPRSCRRSGRLEEAVRQ
jgi:hypothetical protein